MLDQQIRFWLEIIGSAAGIIALFAIALELQRARKADTREFYFHIAEKFNAIIDKSQTLFETDLLDFDELILLPNDHERSAAWGPVLNFWDIQTRSAHDNSNDKKFALEQFGRAFYSF